MNPLNTIAGHLMSDDVGRTIHFTTASGFHEYYEIVAISHEVEKVMLTARARMMDKKFMVVRLAASQPVTLTDRE